MRGDEIGECLKEMKRVGLGRMMGNRLSRAEFEALF